MKHILYFFCLFAIALSAGAKSPGPTLIVRSDDMGSFHCANTACIDCYKNGIETVVEVMAVTPWFTEAARMLNENNGIDVGIHITFTSEWDNIKWRPLTSCPSLTDNNGYFLPMMIPNVNYPGLSVAENRWDLEEIEREARAQIELALKNIPGVSHISGHMGSLFFSGEVLELMQLLSGEYNLPLVDYPEAGKDLGFIPVGYIGASSTPEEKIASFIRMIESLEAGKCYVFLDHPADDSPEMETVGHIGYENVAADRLGVAEMLKNKDVIRAIKDNNVRLATYRELLARQDPV